MDFIGKAKDILSDPTNFFKRIQEQGVADAFMYYLIIQAISTVLGTLVGVTFSLASGSLPGMMGLGGANAALFGTTTIIGMNIGIFFLSLIIIWVGAGILHLICKMFGGLGSYDHSFQAMVYSGTPSGLLGWIPFIGGLAGIWSLVLLFFGVRDMHRLSNGKAGGVLAVLIGLVMFVMFIIMIAFAALFLTALGGSSALTGGLSPIQ